MAVVGFAKRVMLDEEQRHLVVRSGVRRALAEELGCPVLVPPDCQFTGALGAAFLAREG